MFNLREVMEQQKRDEESKNGHRKSHLSSGKNASQQSPARLSIRDKLLVYG